MIRTELIEPVLTLLERRAGDYGSKVAFTNARRSITYGELARNVNGIAVALRDGIIGKGDCVAVYLPNSVDWVESCFGIVGAGGIAVPISYDASENEVLYRLQDADCKVVITTSEREALVGRLSIGAGELKTIIAVDRKESQTDGSLRYLPLTRLKRHRGKLSGDGLAIDEPAFILYTSGTTGRAKGVVLTQRSMLWVVAACWVPIAKISSHDIMLSPLPLFHSYALNITVLGTIATGATTYIMERYSTSECLELLKTGQFTLMPGVPTMFHYMLEGSGEERLNLPSLRLCISAGAIMPATLNREFEKRTGVPLMDGYGITETSTMVTMNWLGEGRILGSCGLPVPGLAVRIVNPITRKDVRFGEEGELIVRGPNLMLRYHNKPEETAKALVDGWYLTGDLARSDANGFLAITGRLKEIIIRGGQNIAPVEIEEVVNTFEGVFDCAVVGAPHKHLGEVPVIFVVPKAGVTLDPDELILLCRGKLSAYKVPQNVIFVDRIPRTGSGKIMRFELKKQLLPASH